MMNLRNHIFLFLISITLQMMPPGLRAQGIVWEKSFGFPIRNDEIGKVCAGLDGHFFALGSTRQYFQQVGNYYANGVMLIKFDTNGDTLFMKRLPVFSNHLIYIGHKAGNIYTAVVQKPRSTPGVGTTFHPFIIDFDINGNVIQTTDFTFQFGVASCIRTSDYGLIMAAGGTLAGTVPRAIKLNFLNEIEWDQLYAPPVPGPRRARKIEPMNNGHFLLSGYGRNNIIGVEIDSAGMEINQKTFYQSGDSINFYEGESLQSWWKSYLSYGYKYSGSLPYIGYLGRMDSLGNRIWGGETTQFIVNHLIPNRENTFIMSKNGNNLWVTRLTIDSVEVWSVLFSAGGNGNVINGLTFTESDTGIVFGYSQQSGSNLGHQFYIAKIAGVGTAYDPTHPEDTVTVSAQERLFRPKDAPVLYPNPVCEHFQFSKLTQESVLAVYSIRGEKLFEKPLQPGEKVNATNLPKGIYLYHIQMGKRVFTGKLVKE